MNLVNIQPDRGMLSNLFLHLEWADQRTLDSLIEASPAPASAVRLFAHIVAADILWLDRIQARPQSESVWPEWTLEEIGPRLPEVWQRFRDVLREDEMERVVKYTNSAGHRFETAVSDILTHVALHAVYHRGQVAQLLRQHGTTPAPTDFIAFDRGFPAATHPVDL